MIRAKFRRDDASALGELRFTRQLISGHQVRESAERGGNPLAFNREQD
jgi:hypothetical protein